MLSQFRQRLIEQGASELVLEPLLAVCRDQGWLKEGGKQRTDATHVLACVRALSSLESVGETLRAALNAIAEGEPAWLLAQIDEAWFDCSVHRFELARLPKAESKRAELRRQVGCDGRRLLKASQQRQAPEAVRDLPQIHVLQHVWQQHDEEVDGEIRLS